MRCDGGASNHEMRVIVRCKPGSGDSRSMIKRARAVLEFRLQMPVNVTARQVCAVITGAYALTQMAAESRA
jgi:hypothetical protein